MTVPPNAYFRTEEEALEEARRRRSSIGGEAFIVRCERTGYGNWCVVSRPAELVVDMLADGPSPGAADFGLGRQRHGWTGG